MTKTKRKKSDKTRSKEKAWKAFSRAIRLRDCLFTTGSTEYGKCCTCGRVFPYGQLQAGHFIAGRNNSILFEPRAVHGQCRGCNLYGHGKQAEYGKFMLEKYGKDTVAALILQANMSLKYTADDYEDIARRFNRIGDIIERNEMVPSEEFEFFIAEVTTRLGMGGER